MTQKKETIRTFRNSSTGEACTPAQYIAEIVCIRKREKENKGSLEYKFWNKSQKDEYQTQIRVANKIIKKYSTEALLHFLNSPKGRRTYSLGFLHSSKKFVLISKYVDKGVGESFEILEEQSRKPKKIIEIEEDGLIYKPKERKTTNTLLNKLRKAQNG
jgi:hypothetical protein